MSLTDRIDGLSGSVAVKAPVVTFTTANITLYGTQTINGIDLAAEDRVLVMAQTNSVENGIYNVKATNWQRAKDFNGNRDIVKGTRVLTADGAAVFRVTSENPIVIDTDAITFAATGGNSPYLDLQTDFGAEGDGVTDDTDAIVAWLAAAQGTGRRVYAPAGTYLMSPYLITELSGDIDVLCDRSARFKYSSAVDQPLFDFTHTDRRVYGLTWDGGIIRNADGASGPAGQANTGMNLTRMWRSKVTNVFFEGEDTLAAATTSLTGTDSGITTVDCDGITIKDCWFKGQGDSGIYISGGSAEGDATDDGEGVVIDGNYFWQCNNGVAWKRDAQGVRVVNNTFVDCTIGAVAAEAVSGVTNLLPGKAGIISGNRFKRIEARAVDVRVQEGYVIENNDIEDWGYLTSDGVTLASSSYGIFLRGANNSIVRGNSLRFLDWAVTPGTHRGIVINPYTLYTILYPGAGNLVAHNNINMGGGVAITEIGATGINYYDTNICDSATTPYAVQGTSPIRWADAGYLRVSAGTGNVGAGEDVLATLDLPANSFNSASNRSVQVRAWGTGANNGNAKTLKIYWGATAVMTVSLTTSQADTWSFDMMVVGATSQLVNVNFIQEGTTKITSTAQATLAETITSDITIKVTGSATSNNDVVCTGMSMLLI